VKFYYQLNVKTQKEIESINQLEVEIQSMKNDINTFDAEIASLNSRIELLNKDIDSNLEENTFSCAHVLISGNNCSDILFTMVILGLIILFIFLSVLRLSDYLASYNDFYIRKTSFIPS